MRAMPPGPAAVQDMDTAHGRLYVAMAEKCLDRADIGDGFSTIDTTRLHC